MYDETRIITKKIATKFRLMFILWQHFNNNTSTYCGVRSKRTFFLCPCTCLEKSIILIRVYYISKNYKYICIRYFDSFFDFQL